METPQDEARALIDRVWDAVVVGTGIGGATLGHALAQAGLSVLFLERGQFNGAAGSIAGDWLEALVPARPEGPNSEERRRAGRLDAPISDVSSGEAKPILPLLGIGTGGSSALYGMVMERFFPSDFTPGDWFSKSGGANLPERWPVSYDEMAPFYARAEALYGVRATPDPLHECAGARGIKEPPPLHAVSRELAQGLRGRGLHPYHVPMACEYRDGCRECLGFLCPMACKNDSERACLKPALASGKAHLLIGCTVERIRARDGEVVGVEASWQGETVFIKGRIVALAAGAVHSPALLLRSGGAGGLANGSGQVGRNLMRHLIDYYLVRTRSRAEPGPVKQLALNDFYHHEGTKLGTLQANGRMPPARIVAAGLRADWRPHIGPFDALWPLARPAVEWQVARMLRRSHIFVSFLEDLPHAENRITLGEDGRAIRLAYKIPPADQERLARFRHLIGQSLSDFRVRPIHRAHLNAMLGHVCGTCRFGDDPATSVLDRNNRTHEVANLYVVDGSFLPTSGGTNPSLTIAANALRVADAMLRTVFARPEETPATR